MLCRSDFTLAANAASSDLMLIDLQFEFVRQTETVKWRERGGVSCALKIMDWKFVFFMCSSFASKFHFQTPKRHVTFALRS